MRTRRTILKTLGGGAGSLALAPFLQRMRLVADGGVHAMPKRFVFVIRGNVSAQSAWPNSRNTRCLISCRPRLQSPSMRLPCPSVLR